MFLEYLEKRGGGYGYVFVHCPCTQLATQFCRNIVRLQVGIKLKFNGFSNCHGRRVICEGGGEEDLWEALKKIEINIWREGGGFNGLLIKELTF